MTTSDAVSTHVDTLMKEQNIPMKDIAAALRVAEDEAAEIVGSGDLCMWQVYTLSRVFGIGPEKIVGRI